uniref:Uncharacterized protein n=1 Tax=Rhizophora mucronata TaxID=61149 RepID=A0A2P2P9U0_RHIMU
MLGVQKLKIPFVFLTHCLNWIVFCGTQLLQGVCIMAFTMKD